MNALRNFLAEAIFSLTPRCHDMTRLLSQARDRRLPWLVRCRVRLHLTVCDLCRRYEAQLGVLHDLLHHHAATEHLPPDATLSEAARERLRRAVSEAE